jgi:hypothetical protein
LPARTDIENVEIWFQDEARVGQHGTITRLWAEKGTRPRAVRQMQFEFSYIFGAVCPSKNVSVGLIIDEVGLDAMTAHLQMISRQVAAGKIAVIILDRASWHKSKKLNCFNNIRLLPLPPASPELNPVEQLWQHLRDRFLANRCFEDMADIVNACCEAWNTFVQEPNAISSLCSRGWAVL